VCDQYDVYNQLLEDCDSLVADGKQS
jgi:hypothetical protein